MLFSAFIERRHRSIEKHAGIVRRLLHSVGHLDLRAISRQHVVSALNDARASGVGESYVRSILCCFRDIMRDAVQDGLADANPTAGLRVRVPKAQVRALTGKQCTALSNALNDSAWGMSAAALLVILWTGLRISEVLALRQCDYDAAERVLTVRSGKTDAAARRVDVPDAVAGTLERYLINNERPHQTTLRRALGAACRAAGIPHMRVHDLRHTRITSLLAAGVPVGYVSRQAGHASAATTLDIYDHWIHVADRDQRRAWANS